ncbi:hypothetical protein BR93DRAFT_502707 [Coniochaeta sp. PMI_546]|nr:hypothetical protein BR93DRAFT_502707 [Coniochaeta sp. PMI_546]
MRLSAALFAGLLALGVRVLADPTWPASTDELEEIMYQLQGFRARLFSDTISPCSNEASGPGRQNAAEWLRVGFHDMATANTYFGIGGLDASLQFELNNGENTGPGHNTTLKFLSNYLSPRSSIADLIAAGVYASVRSCGGPVVPVRAGRIDATSGGSPGVPQPQNTIGTFKDQFDRMGFSVTEMIQVVACGHTLGGVHTSEFPDIVPAGTSANGEVGLDSTVAAFDNKVVTEYLDNSTTNPLVVGPAVKINKHADFKVFNADQNVTMRTLTDPTVFQSTCKTVLQKMIDVVPAGVVLTDPVTPYMVKPVNIQLTLNTPGSTMLLSGYIRVRTTNLPSSSINNIKLTYKDRNGGNNCGTCSTTATVQGSATGFDDSFGFFPISANIDVTTGISSFTVTINLNDGTSQTYDNNGNSYPITDAVLIQKPQSCLLQGSGALTATALVRNDRTSLPVNLVVLYLVPRNTADGNPVPALNNATIAMTKGNCVGQYTFYTASYTIAGGLSYNAKLDIVSGSGADVVSDGFNAASELSGTCATFAGGVACAGSTSSSSLSSSSTSTTRTTSTTSSVTSSSTSTVPTLSHRPKIGAYNLVGCWTEGQNARTLKGAAFAYDGMTLESCMANCAGFVYFGTEYGRECYCDNTLDSTSTSAPLADCNMVCGGDATEYCGAGNRLELYSNAAQTSSSTGTTSTSTSRTSASSTSSSSSTSSTSSTSRSSTTSSSSTASTTLSTTSSTTSSSTSPSQTLGHKATVGKYTLVGCATEGNGVRALSANTYADDAMTLESCASFCDAYSYFGTEYGRECYCGNSLASSSTSAPLSDCSMLCKGNQFEYCGNGNRLELYSIAAVSSRAVSSTTTTSSSSSTRSSTTSTSTSTSSSSSTRTSSSTSTSSTRASTSSSSTTSSSARTSTSTTSTTSTSTSSTASPTLAHKPTVSPYALVGCWTEGSGVRALSANSYSSGTSMTLESCATFCKNYKYFGAEYGGECYCGDSLASSSASAPLSDCNMVCTGNPLEYCGAGNRLELYINNSTGTATTSSTAATATATGPTQPATVSASGTTWAWKNCYTEATTGRALSSTSYAADTVTLESCATFCSAYSYFGTEYGRECYCGNSFAAGSVVAAATDCSFKCAGNANEYCGAGSRLSVYARQ